MSLRAKPGTGFTEQTWERYHLPMALPWARIGPSDGAGGRARPVGERSAGPPADRS